MAQLMAAMCCLKREKIKMKIRGYASLFNRVDLAGDVVFQAAFDQCLKNRAPKQIKMLYHHDVTKPVGCWQKIISTKKGLWVEGDIAIRSHYGKDLAALIEVGALDGLSIGFRVLKAVRGQMKQRHIKEIDLLEISFVTFPMQPAARVITKKIELPSIASLTRRIRQFTPAPSSYR